MPEAITTTYPKPLMPVNNKANTEPSKWDTKGSGERSSFESGMVRDAENGKPRFDLLIPEGMPYSELLLTRTAELLYRGSIHYGDRNWEKAEGLEELKRFKSSAFRHFMQWVTGETDEDHAAACVFNLMGAEYVKWKMAKAVQADG